MVLELECLQKLVEPFCLIEEKRVERFLAPSLSQAKQKYSSLDLVYSSKNFRLFYKPSDKKGLEISISKKNFKSAVKRNKIKRKIKEIFRTNLFLKNFDGVVVFSVFRPFGGLSYSEALKEIGLAVDRFVVFYGNK